MNFKTACMRIIYDIGGSGFYVGVKGLEIHANDWAQILGKRGGERGGKSEKFNNIGSMNEKLCMKILFTRALIIIGNGVKFKNNFRRFIFVANFKMVHPACLRPVRLSDSNSNGGQVFLLEPGMVIPDSSKQVSHDPQICGNVCGFRWICLVLYTYNL